MNPSPNALAQALTLPCGATLPNRLMKSAMTEGLAGPDGRANERHNRLYQAWSEGGTGLLVTGNVMVDYRYLERPGNIVVDGNGGEEELRALAKAGTVNGNHLWMQISHPGRQCSMISNSKPMAPSEVKLKMMAYFAKPRAMTEADIQKAIADYVRVAGIAKATGFTGVQIHGAHGYLLSQFLSPVVNKRDDQWGGSIENRARLLLEVVRGVRAEVGADYPIGVKLNSADFQKGGFTLEESQQVAGWLSEEKIDLLEISGGTYEQLRLIGRKGNENEADEPELDTRRESTKQREAYFLEYAQAIQDAINIPLAVTGGFRSCESMVAAVENKELDVIGLARPLCTQPDIANKLMNNEIEQCPDDENHLQIGKGWLGPNSNINLIKTLNAQATVAWFYRQIIQLSKGEPIRPNLSAFKALNEHFPEEIAMGLARRKALKKQGRSLT